MSESVPITGRLDPYDVAAGTPIEGLTFLGWSRSGHQLDVYTTGGIFRFYHESDCCESVELVECNGFDEASIGERIEVAQVMTVTGDGAAQMGDALAAAPWVDVENVESWTATFYLILTQHMDVDMRWWGESNGYYSESVDVLLIPWTAETLRGLTPAALVHLDAWMDRGGSLGLVS